MTENPKIQRELSPAWDIFIKLAETIHFGRLEQMEFRGKQPRFVRLTYDLNFDDVEDLQKKLDELRTIPLAKR
jgi:hypothetical protein